LSSFRELRRLCCSVIAPQNTSEEPERQVEALGLNNASASCSGRWSPVLSPLSVTADIEQLAEGWLVTPTGHGAKLRTSETSGQQIATFNSPFRPAVGLAALLTSAEVANVRKSEISGV